MNFELVNVETKERESINDPNALNKAILDGTHSFPKGKWVRAFDNRGEYKEIMSDDVFEALDQGYRVATPTQIMVQDYVNENKGIKGMAKVALTQFADEALLGIPEMIFNSTADQLEVAKRDALKKEHELANTIAGIGGFGASFVLGGPLFKAGATAGKSVAKLTAKQGFKLRGQLETKIATALEASGNLTKREAMKHARGLSRKILPVKATAKGLGAAIEGGIISAPHALTEAALGDPETAAEHVLAGVGIGAVFGVGGHLSGKFFRAAAKVTGAKQALEDIKNSLTTEKGLKSLAGSKALQATGINTSQTEKLKLVKEFAEENGEWTIKPINQLSDAELMNSLAAETLLDQGIMSGFTTKTTMEQNLKAKIAEYGPMVGEKLENIDRIYGEAVMVSPQEVAQSLRDNVLKKMRDNPAIQNSEVKRLEKILKKLDATDEASLRDAIEVEAEWIGKELDIIDDSQGKFLMQFEKLLGIDAMGNPSNEFAVGFAKRKLKAAQKARDNIEQFYGKDTRMLGRQLDESTQFLLKNEVMPNYESMPARNILRMLEKQIAVFNNAMPRLEYLKFQRNQLKEQLRGLEKYEAYGERLWTQAEANAVKADFQSRMKQMGKANDQLVPDFYREVAKEINRQMRQRVRDAGGDDVLLDLLKTQERYGNLKAFEHILAKSAAKETSLNDFGLNSFISGGVGSSIGAAFGGGIGGLVGAAAGMGAREISRRFGDQLQAVFYNHQAVKFAAETIIKDGAAKQYDRIPDILKKMAKPAYKVTPVGVAVSAYMRKFNGDEDRKGRRRFEYMEKLSKDMGKLASSPNIMNEELAKITGPMVEGGAPNIGEAMHYKLISGMEYLATQIPRPHNPKNPFAPAQEWLPSDQEIAAFERKLEVVQNPYTVLDELENGTLTKDHIDALKAVYPQIYQTIQKKVQDAVINGNAEPIPYQSRAKLSLLMGAPMDETLTANSIRYYQQSFQTMEAQEQQPAVKANVNVAENHMTNMQRLQS